MMVVANAVILMVKYLGYMHTYIHRSR